ncbi:MAG TPA: hypothetical protein VGU20_02680 [Stellaceae bacterium]|nr:hypothetical protein [Stellaceae bacterium]
MKDEAFKAACLQAAATVWASGKLDHMAGGKVSNPEDQVEHITKFAAMLYIATSNEKKSQS